MDFQIDKYGAGMVKTAGLFLPGRAGYAVAGAAHALDQAKPGDSIANQFIDAGLGLTKGLALKGSFDYVGAKDMSIALKAVSLGTSYRVLDGALTRQTYLNADGKFDLGDGLAKTFDQSFNKTALASDVLIFGLSHGALSGINGITSGALKGSPFWSTVTTGAVFGAASGSAQEINRQQTAGEKFDVEKILTAAALTGVTDMVAAAPGAKLISMAQRPSTFEQNRVESGHTGSGDSATAHESTFGKESSLGNLTGLGRESGSGNEFASRGYRPESLTGEGSELRINPVIQRNLSDSHSREFQLVNGDQRVIDQLRSAPRDPVFAAVREVTPSGVLGPTESLIIQHLEAHPTSFNTINKQAFGGADLIATCNPRSLSSELLAKHILPEAEGVYVTQDQSGRLRFTDAAPAQLKPGESEPIKLDNTVSDVLLSARTPQYVENTHDKSAIAKAMRHFKTPVRFFQSGVDSIAFELPDKSILKITDHGWDETWGNREIWTKKGLKLIDAPILVRPQTIDLPDSSLTYFVQKRLQSPVMMPELRAFDRQIVEDGKYVFWDNDFGLHGRKQLGVDPDNGEIYLIDYDAMRLPHLVPKEEPRSIDDIDRILERYDD
jgi:hypothetical protein